MTKNKTTKSAQIKLRQTVSAIGKKIDQKQTLLGLGLGRIGKEKVLIDTPSIRGMVDKVKHLVKVEEI